MVSFTGSTEVGITLLKRAADRVLKSVMELGGNAPFIVFDDADIDAAVEGAMVAKMRHSAETCTAANRFFVHAAVADEFTTKLSAAMGAIRIGNGMDQGVTCGPMINATGDRHRSTSSSPAPSTGERVWPSAASAAPARGTSTSRPCWATSHPDAAITGHEIFGPVAPVIAFDDTDAMIDQANNTEMGLTAYVYTRDLGRGLSVSERIQAGMVGLNRGRRVRSGGTVRRDEAVRPRPRRCQRRHLRVLRDPVHRHQLVNLQRRGQAPALQVERPCRFGKRTDLVLRGELDSTIGRCDTTCRPTRPIGPARSSGASTSSATAGRS